jgi:hypothetical protein
MLNLTANFIIVPGIPMYQRSRVICLFLLVFIAIQTHGAMAQTLRFSAIGCGPYAPEEEQLLAHYVDLVNRDDQSDFFVHQGDIVTGKNKQWPESQYAKVAGILRQSTRPTFVVLGDNEWNDLTNPDEGLAFWNRNFRNFEQHFPQVDRLEKQAERPENFAFVMKGVLVLGLNIVGGRVHDKVEWKTRLQHDADWVREQFAKHSNDVRAAVLIAQAAPAASHELFFQQLESLCKEWVKPVLYLHADGHVWQLEKGWRAPNLWRVQTDQVKLNPPILVSVTEDPSNPFLFDRRIDIGSRRELFVDDYLVDQHRGTSLKLHRPSHEDVAIVCDAPWEGNISAYYTLFADQDRYRMYYRGAHFDVDTKKSTHPEFTCYAESKDGIHWEKPNLGIITFEGSTENNIILAGEGTHNFSPFLDANPACEPDAKYKALAGDSKGLKAYKSSDGVRWVPMSDKAIITKGDFDSQNIAFWHPVQNRYVAYHRKSKEGFRDIMMSVSTNFLQWNDPRFLDYGDSKQEHLYTNAIQPYFRASHLLIGMPTRYQPSNQQVEPVFMSSRDALSFRRWDDALIPITTPKDRDGNRSNYMAYGVIPSPTNQSEIYLYATEAYYAGPGSRLRRFTIRTDGFVSVHADDKSCEFLTKPITFSGSKLQVNFQSRSNGHMRIELQDIHGKPYPGYSLADCVPLVGDAIDATVEWNRRTVHTAKPLSSIANRPVRIRVEMQNTDLFSFQFRE